LILNGSEEVYTVLLFGYDMNRPDNDTYFMDMAQLISTRSTCVRRQVGAVIVKDKRVLTTGYNGSPKGTRHCEDLGCIRDQQNIPSGTRHELCRGVHAEQNAVIQAAYFGISIDGATIYTTTYPCSMCSKILINAGIKEIIYADSYLDELSVKLFEETNIVVRKFMPKTVP
jgi:dCMP deaminase